MPKRRLSHPFVTRLGARFHKLRKERKLSLQALTEGKSGGSKGYVSQFERGQALPTLVALDRMAERLGVDIIDVVNFPERGLRNQLLEIIRGLGDCELKQLLAQAAAFGIQQPRRKSRSA
jgi:transcriptional regulator with XRE-family HTH domain